MFMRHAEKPENGDRGVSPSGKDDPESLTPRGWQRAGALARFFCPQREDRLTPTVIFAAGVGHGSPSRRSIETVTPLVELLSEGDGPPVPFVTSHLKDDDQDLIDDVLTRDGAILVCWEHKRIPALIALLPDAPTVPSVWPDDRFDMVWELDRTASGWTFSQRPQLVLAGDSAEPIG